jgi:hypothetical protein
VGGVVAGDQVNKVAPAPPVAVRLMLLPLQMLALLEDAVTAPTLASICTFDATVVKQVVTASTEVKVTACAPVVQLAGYETFRVGLLEVVVPAHPPNDHE